jgi:hypothetical protein
MSNIANIATRPESMVRITNEALAKAFIDEQVAEIRKQVGDKKVLLALSGGVDSSVVAALLIKAIGKQLVCVHVNHGLMRKGESEQVIEIFGNNLDANLIYIDATDRYLDLLAGVNDPETKRKIIGKEFIEIFVEEARKLVLRFISRHDENERTKDYKTTLQEIIQRNPEEHVEYVVTDSSGPDHAKIFEVEARMGSNIIGHGSGKTKKDAEQNAAREALRLFGEI